MKLALNLGYMVGADDPQGQLALTRHAESLGFDSVWAAEAYGSDCVSVLAWLAGQTERIGVGSAIMQIPGRTPAMAAMTAASMDMLAPGRFRMGLGVSGPQVSEGWHGVRFARPLERTRDYLEIVGKALAGEKVEHHGRHHDLPIPGGPGKALKLMVRPPSEHIPTYLAAVGPKNLELAGELCDGWLAVFFAAGYASEQLASIEAGRQKVGKSLEGFDVVPTFPLVVGGDVAACADPVRPYAALYVGGMGSKDKNFYNALARRMGFEKEADRIQELYLARQQRDAMAEVPVDFIDQTSLLGDEGRLADRLRELADAGVTTCALSPVGRTTEEKLAALTVAARAAESL
ncbi:LLM class F420-dependent oxidoreductase [Mariniluteicoccus endophyticus]